MIEAGDETVLNGRTICDDCYMDQLSPTRICDPWAVHHAKSSMGDEVRITADQQRIIDLLEETGGLELGDLAMRLDLSAREVERHLAALRHMERIRARPENGRKIFCLWSD
jgi:predicted transcriptional regulator